MAAVARNRFYLTIALTLAIVVFVGFSPTYYLRAFFDQPPLTRLVHLHGLVFSAWLLLFVAQTRFIAVHNVRAHMKLGIAGAVLAIIVVIVGVATAIASLSSPRPHSLGMTSQQFLAIPLTGITLFAGFVATAIALRRRAALHKRFMVLAMIAVLGPPIARLLAFTHTRELFLIVQTAVPAIFVIWCLLNDWIRYRIVHPVFALGGMLIVLSWPLRVMLGKSDLWVSIVQSMTG